MSSSRKKVTIKVVEKPKSSTKKTKKIIATLPRAAGRIKGSGDYRPTSFQRVRGRGDYLGDLVGGLGQKFGNWAQGRLSSLFGFGDYRTHGPKSNSLSKMVNRAADTRSENTSASSPSQNPFVMGAMSVQFAGGPPRIQHREFVGAIYATGSSTFSTTAYRIQPGLRGSTTLFPWGNSVASCFQMYELHGCVLEYVSTSSNYSATSALGSVSLSTVYDAEKPPLATLLEVNNNEFTTSANPSVSFYHPVECARGDAPTTVKYVRTSNSVQSSTDERLDDVGIFQVSLNGLVATAGTQVGELWCSYDITFLKAALPDLHAGTTALFTAPSAPALADLLGTEGYLISNPQNSLPVVVSHPLGLALGACRFNLPTNYNGNYQLTVVASMDLMTSTANVQIIGKGTDVSYLDLLPQNIGSTPSLTSTIAAVGINFATLPGTTVNNVMSFTMCFSTIAENDAENYIDLLVAGGAEVALPAPIAAIAVLFSPLDNDIASASMLLERRMKTDPQFREMVALMQRQRVIDRLVPASIGEPTPPPPIKDCPASIQAAAALCSAQMRSSRAAASSSDLPHEMKTDYGVSVSAPPPPPPHKVLSRVMIDANANYEDDHWVQCATPRSQPTPPTSLFRRQQSTGEAEDALHAAIDAAIKRRGLVPPS